MYIYLIYYRELSILLNLFKQGFCSMLYHIKEYGDKYLYIISRVTDSYSVAQEVLRDETGCHNYHIKLCLTC